MRDNEESETILHCLQQRLNIFFCRIKRGHKTNFIFSFIPEIKEVRPEVEKLLADNEKIMCAFKTIRDQVIFTNNRIFVVNVKGVTGKKIAYFSYPYSKIQYYGIETAGFMDIDSELILTFSNGHILQFDFKSNVDIRMINSIISKYVL